jgi:hypothetical protein
VLTSRSSLGQRLRAARLLMTPEETSPPEELQLLARSEPLLAPPEADASPVSVPQRVALSMVASPASYFFGIGRGSSAPGTAQSAEGRVRGGSGRGGVVRGESVRPVMGDRLAAPQTIDLSERQKNSQP